MDKTYDLEFFDFQNMVILYDEKETNRYRVRGVPVATVKVKLGGKPIKSGKATFYYQGKSSNVISPVLPSISKAREYGKQNGIKAGDQKNKTFWGYCNINESVYDNF